MILRVNRLPQLNGSETIFDFRYFDTVSERRTVSTSFGLTIEMGEIDDSTAKTN
jgi:hypothetical protein